MFSKFLFHKVHFTPLAKKIKVGGTIGLFVFFILLVFQPFGTYSFTMANKTFFLAGYGLVTAVSYMLFFAAGNWLFPKWFTKRKWNLLKELIVFFGVFNIMAFASLVYHHSIIGGYKITLSVYFNFLKYSIAIASIPFFVLYYQKWILSRMTKLNIENVDNLERKTISFYSNNKNELPIVLSEDQILYLKSDGNYIEIFYLVDSKIEKQIIRNTLNNVQSNLPLESFYKIHRSHLVNLSYAKSIELNRSNYELSLKYGEIKLPVSRSVVKTLKLIIV